MAFSGLSKYPTGILFHILCLYISISGILTNDGVGVYVLRFYFACICGPSDLNAKSVLLAC